VPGCLQARTLLGVTSQPSLFTRWQALNDWLLQYRTIWQPAPFMEPAPAWIRLYPELARLVTGLDDSRCAQLAEDVPEMARLAATCVPGLGLYHELVTVENLVPPVPVAEMATLPETRAADMPGRKRRQSGVLAAALAPLTAPVLDWCCGKGHLARTLSALCPEPVQGYEWNPDLVQDGNRLARRYGDPVTLHCQDVMDATLDLPGDSHVVALHACGDLHRQLLEKGCAAQAPRLSLSPCCYHRTRMEVFQPLSQAVAGHESALSLSRSDLRLVVRETVTAPARVRSNNALLNQWRLGFDGLQRQLRGKDEYLSLPTYPAPRMAGGFSGFCHWAAELKGLSLPAEPDHDHWLEYGARRLHQVRRHELVRHLFRRPLELWLLLDYGLYLQEQGYRVRLGQFCERALTPRNLLIDAVRVSGKPPSPHSHP